MRLYSTANERGLISQQPFYLPIGKVQAGRPRSVGLACKRLYSTANERGLYINRFFCLPSGKL
ncbi:MAG: hypothetical protein LBP59_07300 [Planctomycetaceae bacterium]|nr:hypothetical protein [Planctomycetaceae bacterium]